MRVRGKVVFAFIMLFVSMILFAQTFSYPVRSRVFPLTVGIVPLFIFSFFQIVTEFRKGKKEGSGGGQGEAAKIEWKKTLIVFSWIIGFMILVGFIGFLMAIPIFSFLFLLSYFRENWRIALAISVMTIAVVYVLYVMVFSIPLYRGIF